MPERKPQTKYIPLRVRFRSLGENVQNGREQIASTLYVPPPQLPDLTHASEAELHAQQIKETRTPWQSLAGGPESG